jgi:hypothetical protein
MSEEASLVDLWYLRQGSRFSIGVGGLHHRYEWREAA